MSVKLQRHGFHYSSSSTPLVSRNSIGNHASCKKMADLDFLLTTWGSSRKKCLIRLASSDNGNYGLNFMLGGYRKHYATFSKSRRMEHCSLLASTEDGITVNGSPRASTSSDLEEIRVKLKQSRLGGDYSYGLVQSLHDAARFLRYRSEKKSHFQNCLGFQQLGLV